MNQLVKFVNLLEEGLEENYGILLPTGNVLCLCCGGEFEPEDYKIIEREIPWKKIHVAQVRPTVVVEVSGGLVQNAYATDSAIDVEVFDFDNEDTDEDAMNDLISGFNMTAVW